MAYILAPIEGCDDRGYRTDPAQGLTGVKAIDAQTLQVTLRYPFSDFPATLGHPVAAVTPVDYMDQVGAKAFARRPVGTGPYAVKSWRRGRDIPLAKNPPSRTPGAPAWVDHGRPAHLRRHGDHVDRLPARQASTARGADGPGRRPCTAGSEVANGTWTARSWPAAALYFVGMNMTDPTLWSGLDLRKAVRQSADARRWSTTSARASQVASGYAPAGVPGCEAAQNPSP